MIPFFLTLGKETSKKESFRFGLAITILSKPSKLLVLETPKIEYFLAFCFIFGNFFLTSPWIISTLSATLFLFVLSIAYLLHSFPSSTETTFFAFDNFAITTAKGATPPNKTRTSSPFLTILAISNLSDASLGEK